MIEKDIAPYFIIIALLSIVSHFIIKYVPFFKDAVENSKKNRYSTLDGLRGFLALSVFFHHAVVTYNSYQSDLWGTRLHFYAFLGEGSVSFFFMITGFLFWSKAIQGGDFNAKKFYVARALRIYPLYWFSLLLIVLITWGITNFSINLNLKDIPQLAFQWLFCIFIKPTEVPSINGLTPEIVNAKVYWTLVYEILFYLIFPILLVFVKPIRFIALSVIVFLLSGYLFSKHLLTIQNFFFGMSAAYIVKQLHLEKKLSHWIFSLLALVLLSLIPIVLSPPYIINQKSMLIIFIVFLLFLYGSSIFGLLTTSVSRYFGIISYDVYLLHGIVLFSAFKVMDRICSIKSMNALQFWIFVAFCGVVTIVVSGITHRYIEYPFMQKKGSLNFLFKSKK